jgi:hypothetical protein
MKGLLIGKTHKQVKIGSTEISIKEKRDFWYKVSSGMYENI